jgi:hypothetical protein
MGLVEGGWGDGYGRWRMDGRDGGWWGGGKGRMAGFVIVCAQPTIDSIASIAIFVLKPLIACESHTGDRDLVTMVDAHIKAAIDYLRVAEASGISDDMRAQGVDNQIRNIKSIIAHTSIDIGDATRAFTTISESSLSAPHKQELLHAVHTRVGAPLSSTTDSDNKGQQHKYIFNYMTEAGWQKQCDPNCSELERCIDMIKLCHQIGLYFPDVITLKTIVSTMLMAHGTSPTPLGAKALYDLFVSQNKQRRPLKKFADMSEQVFPESVASFIELHPDKYHEAAKPVRSRVSGQEVTFLAPTLAARNTHTFLRSSSASTMQTGMQPAFHMGAASSSMNTMNPMMMLAQHMFNAMQPRQDCVFSPMQDGVFSPRRSPRAQQAPALTDESVHGDSSGAPLPLKDKGDDADGVGGDATTLGSEDKRSELDKLLDINLNAGKPVKIGAPTPKKKPTPPAVASPKTPVVKSCLKKPAASESLLVFTAHSPPKLGTPCPFMFLGCKVLCTASAYRVFPKPGKSVYDKSFKHSPSKATAFKAMIEFCKKPSIPKDSKNYVK